ncbi:glycosyltransferase family 4 protein [Nostoc sp. UIC 10607]|uniref:glycosyltransferase family 4 protein n=1 Tax=Nostoc sp. UIC 10607 TaxID=3045935 RepID=UPI0039A1E688
MHIVIVNPFDSLPWESKRRHRYTMLVDELIIRGHRLSWIVADFDHSTKQYRSQITTDDRQCLKVIFVHVPPYYKNVSLQRIISHRIYASGVSQALKSLHASEPVDVVIASIPPIESSRVAMEFCAATHAVGIVDMQDAWPKAITSVFPHSIRNFLSDTLLHSLKQNLKMAADIAEGLVAVSPEYLDYLLDFRKCQGQAGSLVLPLGFDSNFIQISEVKPKNFEMPLTVSYIGNFSHFYDLETVIKAAEICADQPIKFTLIGDGTTYDKVKQLAETLGVKNVNFKGRLNFEVALPILRHSDVGLVPFTSDWPSNFPNKVFDYLSLGIPVISSIKGNFQKILKEYKFGLQYEAGNPKSLADALLQSNTNRKLLHEMGTVGLEYAKNNMDGNTIYQQYANFVENLATPYSVVGKAG